MTNKLTDQDLVKTVLKRNKWTHQQLGEWLCVSRVSITHVVGGRAALRAATRRKLEQMMDGLILVDEDDKNVAEQGINVK